MVDDRGELGHPPFETSLLVLIEEEPGVREPRAQHALVALHDRRRVGGLQIADDEKAVREAAIGIGKGEILLVLLHRQDQAFLRHSQERRVETAGVDDRPFDERIDLVDQRIGHDDGRATRSRLQRGHDLAAPIGEARDHLALGGERLLVGVGGGNLDSAAAEESVSVGHATGGESECRHRHDSRAVQREQPMCRPDELDRGAIRALIRHHFGDRQPPERVVERGLESARQRDAGGHRVQEHRIGLAIRFAGEPVVPVDRVRPEIGQVRAAEPREALAQRGGGAVVGVERNAHRHQLLRERLVR